MLLFAVDRTRVGKQLLHPKKVPALLLNARNQKSVSFIVGNNRPIFPCQPYLLKIVNKAQLCARGL